MNKDLIFEGKKYISSKQASKPVAYTSDYVGQLCREGKLDAKMVGRGWFISEESILNHKSMNSKSNSALDTPNIKVSESGAASIPITNLRTFVTTSPFSLQGLYSKINKSNLSNRISNISNNLSSEILVLTDNFFNRETIVISFLFLVVIGNIAFMNRSFFPNLIPPINIEGRIAAVSEAVSKISSIPNLSSSEIHNQNTKKAISYIKQSLGNFSDKVLSILNVNSNKDFATNISPDIQKENDLGISNVDGIVISPSVGSKSEDEVLKQHIRNSFSDEVEIKADESRSAGVITPVFKSATKDNYIYVMVPKIEEKK